MITIIFDSKPTSVLCHMGDFGCGDGGWIPVMKVNGNKDCDKVRSSLCRCLFDSFCHWFSIKFLKLYLVSCQFICRVFKLILVKLSIVCAFTIISQGAPLGLAVEMN